MEILLNVLISYFLIFFDNLYSETMSILNPCEIGLSTPPEGATTIISINNIPIGAQGNLLGITGGEGTGKSNYAGSLLSGTIREADTPVDTLGAVVAPNISGHAVLWYDTEQSQVQLYKNMCNVLRRSNLTVLPTVQPSWFKVYCLTSMSRKDRIQSITQSMDKFYYEFGGIHMVLIDGIADLICCPNDERESLKLIEELYRLAAIYNTCIICVLHFVPSGLKLRGHLGSELQRKAAGIVSIERDDNPRVSVVKALKVRDGSPLDVPMQCFAWDKEKGMHTYQGEKTQEENRRRQKVELAGIARNLFNRKTHYMYIELCELIQSDWFVSERTAKYYIKLMGDQEIIKRDPENASLYIFGNV
jgi:hypothetical protein